MSANISLMEEDSADLLGHKMYDQLKPQRQKLRSLWHELYGTDPVIETTRQDAVMKHVTDLFTKMIEEEEENKEETIERVESLLKEQATLERELHIEIKANVNDKAPLCEIEANLHSALESYRCIKTERLAMLQNYVTKEKQICKRLGTTPQIIDYIGVPSEDELLNFQKHLTDLEQKVAEREQIFVEKKCEILDLYSRLEAKATLSFELAVTRENEKTFKLTDNNLEKLEELLVSLRSQEDRAKAEAEELVSKLSLIWERLHESNEYREQCLITHSGYGKSAINGLKQELKRCEELKRKHIQHFIQEVRREIESWWYRLHYAENQKNMFEAYLSQDFSEELLELHELEVSKLRQYYEKNCALYQLIDERNKLWDKMNELNDKSKNADRLFKNRGGQLLKEEKERKQIARDLPKIEKELKKLLCEYETANGSPFLFDGVSFLELMEDQWKENSACKEAQKIARKVANSTIAPSPLVDRKRKVNTPATSQSNISKRPRNEATPSKTPNRVKIRRMQNTPSTTKIPSVPLTRSQRGYKFAPPTKPAQTHSFSFRSPSTNTSSSSLASYSVFQEHLDVREKTHIMPCRSSTSTRAALKENTQVVEIPLKSTPIRTPMKHTMIKTPRSASSKIPTPNRFTGPRLTTMRGKLPIII
nr:PREDICTED: protein regulator of cytokinesis 1-like isoform X1 [Bemisia tabaci]